MWLLNAQNKRLEEFSAEDPPKYSILSHRWGREEVLFKDMWDGNFISKAAYPKIEWACNQALKDRIGYVWVDTCCIDKSSSAEVAESITSMYRWYARSERCYVYLQDVYGDIKKTTRNSKASYLSESHVTTGCPDDLTQLSPTADQVHSIEEQFLLLAKNSRWFTRGWTLQEMLAPVKVEFFNSYWHPLASLQEVARAVTKITGVHETALRSAKSIGSFSIAQRMCWAANRVTKKPEDRAYSLLGRTWAEVSHQGIFDVSIPIIYGEGTRAFQRLQEELLRVSSDQTIFTWFQPKHQHQAGAGSLLAASPEAFLGCERFVPVQRDERQLEITSTNRDIRFKLPTYSSASLIGTPSANSHRKKAILSCCLEDDITRVLALNVDHVPGTIDTYVVADGKDRIEIVDRYAATQWCGKAEALNILRQKGHHAMLQNGPTETVTTIMCRIKPSTLKGAPLRFVHAGSTPANTWRDDSQAFIIQSPLRTSEFFDELKICQEDRVHARLEIRLNRGKTSVKFISEQSQSILVKVASHYDHPMSYHNGLLMVAKIGPRELLHGVVDLLLEIETVSGTTFIVPLCKFLWSNLCESYEKFSWQRGIRRIIFSVVRLAGRAIWSVISFCRGPLRSLRIPILGLQLPLGILLPLLVIKVARGMAYAGYPKFVADSGWEVEEWVLLLLALPTLFLINIFLELGGNPTESQDLIDDLYGSSLRL